MNLTCTPEEYRTLVKLVRLGEMIMEGEDGVVDPQVEAVTQNLYKLGAEGEHADILVKDEEYNLYAFHEDHEDALLEEVMDPFVEGLFWEELLTRLVKRDMDRHYPELPMLHADDEPNPEFFQKVVTLEEGYRDEFGQNGVLRMVLDTTLGGHEHGPHCNH